MLGAYTVLAFAVGVAAGLMFRNTLASMAITLGVYLIVLIGVEGVARPHYLAAERITGTVAESTGESERGGRSWIPDDAWRVGFRVLRQGRADDLLQPVGLRRHRDHPELPGQAGSREAQSPTSPASHVGLPGRGDRVFLVLSAGLLGLGAWSLRRRVL